MNIALPKMEGKMSTVELSYSLAGANIVMDQLVKNKFTNEDKTKLLPREDIKLLKKIADFASNKGSLFDKIKEWATGIKPQLFLTYNSEKGNLHPETFSIGNSYKNSYKGNETETSATLNFGSYNEKIPPSHWVVAIFESIADFFDGADSKSLTNKIQNYQQSKRR